MNLAEIWRVPSNNPVQAFPKIPGHEEKGHYSDDDNTSHLVTKLLPSFLEPHSKYNATKFKIQILNPTAKSAVKSEYGFVRSYCKDLWEKYGNSIDLIVHLGMADGWEWYSVERSAWKEGTIKSVDYGNGMEGNPVEYYTMPDDIGETIKDLKGSCPWSVNVPKRLMAGPGIDVDTLARSVEKSLNATSGKVSESEIEVRSHNDAGNYLCGFISYESFAQAFVKKYSAKAIFCHIPGWRDAERLENGRDFVCTLISSIVAQVNGS